MVFPEGVNSIACGGIQTCEIGAGLRGNTSTKRKRVCLRLTRPAAATKVGRIGNPSYKDALVTRASYELMARSEMSYRFTR